MSGADPNDFKQAARRFASGVTVVTTRRGPEVYGLTVSAFSTLSIDPLLILVCVRTGNVLSDMVSETQRFVVNILREEQRSVSQYFATPGRAPVVEEFPDIPTRNGATGAPVIENSLAYFDCALEAAHIGGDHMIFVGRVVSAGATEGWPLVYFDGDYRGVREWAPAVI